MNQLTMDKSFAVNDLRSAGCSGRRIAATLGVSRGAARRQLRCPESNSSKAPTGSVVAWPDRFNHDELSAIRHAMNLTLQDEAACFAQYQNEPLVEQRRAQAGHA